MGFRLIIGWHQMSDVIPCIRSDKALPQGYPRLLKCATPRHTLLTSHSQAHTGRDD